MNRSPVLASGTAVSMIDYPGRMAGVLFFAGCNLRCGFCHNAALLADPPDEARLTWAALDRTLDRFRGEWVNGLVLTGGEPTLSPDLHEVVRRGRMRGFDIKLDTNGTRPSALKTLLPQLDTVALDIKASPAGYSALTGLTDTTPIGTSLKTLREGAVDYELRTTVIEPFHTDEEMDRMAEWISGARRWILQPFIPRPDLPDPSLRNLPRTRPQRLAACCRRYARAADEVTVRAGNAQVSSAPSPSTSCWHPAGGDGRVCREREGHPL